MTFALITEGISEHRVIKHILSRYFKDYEPDITQIQPKIVANKQEGTGGWNEVLSYCSDGGKLKATLVENEYLIIQIDTDQSQILPFGISHTNADNKEKSVGELYADVVAKLTALIHPEIIEAFSKRIFFAVCVHTIECWLLPIYYTNHHKSHTRNCIDTLNKELYEEKLDTLAKGNKNNPVSIRAYDAILKNWKKKQDIVDVSRHNTGFEKFVAALENVANAPAG